MFAGWERVYYINVLIWVQNIHFFKVMDDKNLNHRHTLGILRINYPTDKSC